MSQPWCYLNDGSKLEVLSLQRNKNNDMVVEHRHNGRIGHSVIRNTPRGEHYFVSNHQRVYVSDLRRN